MFDPQHNGDMADKAKRPVSESVTYLIRENNYLS